MTIDQFLEQLKLIASHFTWSINPQGEISGSIINKECWALESRVYKFCPLGAVYLLHQLNFRTNWDWDKMARILNMENLDAYHIVGAADTPKFNPELRSKILEAVGLHSLTY